MFNDIIETNEVIQLTKNEYYELPTLFENREKNLFIGALYRSSFPLDVVNNKPHLYKITGKGNETYHLKIFKGEITDV